MPTLANHVIAQVVLPRVNNLAADAVINTLHFHRITGSYETSVDELAAVINTFYNVATGPGQAHSIAYYINATIYRGVNQMKINFYDGSLAPGIRAPTTKFYTVGAVGPSGVSLPDEVACCLSYKNVNPALSDPFASRMGRIFIGPLSALTLAVSGVENDARPAPEFLTDLREAGKVLQANAEDDADCVWSVYSPKLNKLFDITEVSTDNAFDTQRRRGLKASFRTTLDVVHV